MSPLVPHTEKGMNFPVLSEPDSPRNEPKQHLLYSVKREIRLHLDGEKNEFLIAERPDWVRSLAIYNGLLVDAGDYNKIRYTETGEIIAERSAWVKALTIRDNHLIDGGDYFQIRYTETGEPIAERLYYTDALTIRDNHLIDAHGNEIRYTETGKLIGKHHRKTISALTVHDNRLVHAEGRIGPNPLSKILYTETGELIAERPGRVNALAVYNGRLIDAGDYWQIRYTERDKLMVATENEGVINSLLPIDNQMAERLLKLPEVEEIE
jgi:hypothetical protein